MSRTPQRIVPEIGIPIPDEDRQALTEGTGKLKAQINSLRGSADAKTQDFICDLEVFYNAVHYALEQDIFYKEEDVEIAQGCLQCGAERAEQLSQGKAPWTEATGLVVRGYRSKLDDSVQPYGLVVPKDYDAGAIHRLDVWHHGRNNQLSELRFINERQMDMGRFTPDKTIVLHTYGRFCNAMKFAGEVDTFEAMDHVKQHYTIDEDRICVRGFSMGGAATWHMAVHYAGLWAGATPGAGFAETAVYQNVFEKEPHPPDWEQKLWGLYDATKCAGNLHQCPTIAYSGELDQQMQAADIMAEYMKKEGLDLVHIIGPEMGHNYDQVSKDKIQKRLSEIVDRGVNHVPERIRFTTYTLRYNEMNWVRIDGLVKHWERTQVNADIVDDRTIEVNTENVFRLTLEFPAGLCPLKREENLKVILDGEELTAPPIAEDGSWTVYFGKGSDGWCILDGKKTGLRKVHGLQGPIDDAFLDGFVMVTPTGTPMMGKAVTDWIEAEQENAIYQWQMQFRGPPRVKTDGDVTDEDIAEYNLILWGHPESNGILKKIADQLPIVWRDKEIVVGDRSFSSDQHVPVMIFPNPLNPDCYIVLNSGFTFMQNGSASNASQTPKLPDWAVLDISVPASERIPAGVIACDFFNETWNLI